MTPWPVMRISATVASTSCLHSVGVPVVAVWWIMVAEPDCVLIQSVGTRGRGCASALISAVVEAAAAGKPRARLDVDTRNATGALGVYERLGFVATGGEIAFASASPPQRRARP
jgi:predicted GNAT family acetyltransferase